jgi:RimJ/RimL family protein N-acetyltransferase
MTEAVSAITRVGFELCDLGRIEIRCHPDNIRSAAIPRRLGYQHVDTVDDADGDPALVFALEADGYPGSPAAHVELEANDVLGRRISP